MTHSSKYLRTPICAVLLFALLGGCSQYTSTGNEAIAQEAIVSKLFRICADVPASAQLKQRTAADVEFITYSADHVTYDITLGHKPSDFRRISAPPVVLDGPLNVVVLGTQSDSPGHRYIIEFDSIGAALPHTYGSIQITRNTQTEPDNMFVFLADWRRCP